MGLIRVSALALAILAIPSAPLAAQEAANANDSVPHLDISQWENQIEFTDRGAGGAGNTLSRIFVAPLETRDKWTRQAREVKINSFAIILTPKDSVESASQRLKSACPETRVGEITMHKVDAFDAAMQRADCPLNPKSGLPLIVISSAWTDQLDVQVKTVMFTYDPSEEDIRLAQDFVLSPAFPVDWSAY